MTREIKFRAWDGKKMLFPEFDMTIQIDGDYCGFTNGRIDYGDYIQPEALMQFTGLRDKFGKEIYECDIVRGNLANEMGSYENSVGKVFFNTDRAEFAIECDTYPDNQWSIPKDIEVIGNVMENPELLR